MKKKIDKGVPTGLVPLPVKKKNLPKIEGPEVCPYCGASYHPMPIYTLAKAVFGKKAQIYVCHSEILNANTSRERWIVKDECRLKALADGYIHRPDLGKGA